jgi:hypothetical protein
MAIARPASSRNALCDFEAAVNAKMQAFPDRFEGFACRLPENVQTYW